jgi:hypothetical protein
VPIDEANLDQRVNNIDDTIDSEPNFRQDAEVNDIKMDHCRDLILYAFIFTIFHFKLFYPSKSHTNEST